MPDTDTNPDLWQINPAFERLLNRDGRLYTPSDTKWHALPLKGFGKLRLQQMFQLGERPVPHLRWVVAAAQGWLDDFPDGLILRYAIGVAWLGSSDSFPSASELRSLATVHLKSDLFEAAAGELPRSARGIVFLDERGRVKDVFEF